MKQKRKVSSFLFNKTSRGLLFSLLCVLGGILYLGLISSLPVTEGAGGNSNQVDVYYKGVDDKVEVLYNLSFMNGDNSSNNEMYVSDGNTYMLPRALLINPRGAVQGVLLNSNYVGWNDVFGHILGGSDNKVNSDNVTLMAGENNEVKVDNSNVTLLGGKNNLIGTGSYKSVMIGGDGNFSSSSSADYLSRGYTGEQVIIGGNNNRIDGTSSTILGGYGNVISGSHAIVGGSNVNVEGSVDDVFVFSDGFSSFIPRTDGNVSSGTFYLNVMNGLGVNQSSEEGVKSKGSVGLGNIDIETIACTTDDYGVQGVWEGCLVGCTSASLNNGGKWEMLDRGDECQNKCESDSGEKCITLPSNKPDNPSYSAFCTQTDVHNATMCNDRAYTYYENVIFETYMVDSDLLCPSGDNKCVFRCNNGTHLTGDTTGKGNGLGCYKDCNLWWNPGDVTRHNLYAEGNHGTYLCVDGGLELVGCESGYHTEDGTTCIGNVKSVSCGTDEVWKPTSSHYEDKYVNVEWIGGWNSGYWSDPENCGWECDRNYHTGANNLTCDYNFKYLQCNTVGVSKPSHSEYDIKSDWVFWTQSAPNCGYNCNYGYTGSTCDPMTQTGECTGLPSNSYWVNSGFTQVRSGDSWASFTGSNVCVDGNSSTEECAFACESNYKCRGNSECVLKETPTCNREYENEAILVAKSEKNLTASITDVKVYPTKAEAEAAADKGEKCVYYCNTPEYYYADYRPAGTDYVGGTCLHNVRPNCYGEKPENATLVEGTDHDLPYGATISNTVYSGASAAEGKYCAYLCDEGYVYQGDESSGGKCVWPTQTGSCEGLPSNASWINSKFMQVWSGDVWTPGTGFNVCVSGDSSTDGCAFKCDTGYKCNGNDGCVLKEVAKCTDLPANAHGNNDKIPSKSTKYTYSTDTSKVCTFQCDIGYKWDSSTSSCVCNEAEGYFAEGTSCVKKYKLTYNYSANGGASGPSSPVYVKPGDSVDLSKTATKNNWTFKGWYTTANSACNTLSSYTMPASDVTLYAIFEKQLYINLHLNGAQAVKVGDVVRNSDNPAANGCTVCNNTSCKVELTIQRDGWDKVGFNASASSTTNSTKYNQNKDNKLQLDANDTGVSTWYAITSKNLTATFENNGDKCKVNGGKTTKTWTLYNKDNLNTVTGLPSITTSGIGVGRNTNASSTTSKLGQDSQFTVIVNNNGKIWYPICVEVTEESTDQTKPEVSLTVTETKKSTSQTATLKCTDNYGVTAYYWGTTEPTSVSSITTTDLASLQSSSGLTKTVASAGTYWLGCRDAAGNRDKKSVVIRSYTVHNMYNAIIQDKGTYDVDHYPEETSQTYLVQEGTKIEFNEEDLYTIPKGSGVDKYKGYTVAAEGTPKLGTISQTLNDNVDYYFWFDRNEYCLRWDNLWGDVTIQEVNMSGKKAQVGMCKYTWYTNGETRYASKYKYGTNVYLFATAGVGETWGVWEQPKRSEGSTRSEWWGVENKWPDRAYMEYDLYSYESKLNIIVKDDIWLKARAFSNGKCYADTIPDDHDTMTFNQLKSKYPYEVWGNLNDRLPGDYKLNVWSGLGEEIQALGDSYDINGTGNSYDTVCISARGTEGNYRCVIYDVLNDCLQRINNPEGLVCAGTGYPPYMNYNQALLKESKDDCSWSFK